MNSKILPKRHSEREAVPPVMPVKLDNMKTLKDANRMLSALIEAIQGVQEKLLGLVEHATETFQETLTKKQTLERLVGK